MNAWFPKLRQDGTIVSGDKGIWITPPGKPSFQWSDVGTSPIWAGNTLVFNLNNGSTSVDGTVIGSAYTSYTGSTTGPWAGFVGNAVGFFDVYNGSTFSYNAPGACAPRFGGSRFAYLTPYQTGRDNIRTLVVDNIATHTDTILDVILEPSGAFYVYQTATSTYGRQIKDSLGKVISIRDDEAPIVAFTGPDNAPWLVTGTVDAGVFIRPVYSFMGYRILGDMYYPDAKMFAGWLQIVASYANGTPRFDNWIDFSMPREDLRVSPVKPVTFSFTHPVTVYPFKAEGSGQPDIFTLGTYSEEVSLPTPMPEGRYLLAHDGTSNWVIPKGLRNYDMCLIECYLSQGETLKDSVSRWLVQAQSLLSQWSGDCGLIPMFYCQGGAPPNELWPISTVLQGLQEFSPVVNLSPRIKVIAPFAYNRANGIIAHPELQQALNSLVSEMNRVGQATLTPLPKPPIPPDPPKPKPFREHKKDTHMSTQTVVLRGPGGLLGRPDAPNTGPWASEKTGWRGVIWDGLDASDIRYHHFMTSVENQNYSITHASNNGLAGADATKYSGSIPAQFYYKPDGNPDRGDYETWRVYTGNENSATQAQVEYSDDRGKYFSCSVAIEVV